jgi:Abnormal spindle-like microcephaly-assoc'd, ASPM-SPD-2-Hydin
MSAAAETVTANFTLALSVNTGSLDFGTVYLGTTTVNNVKLKNQGASTLSISAPTISNVTGGASTEYVVAKGCPSSLASNESCTISVSFGARAFFTPQSATLNLMSSPGILQTVSISALVINPEAELSAAILRFGDELVNQTSSAEPITLTNVGATPLAISGISLAGGNPQDYVETNNCPGSLAAGNSCTISVTFTPSAKGGRPARLEIQDNAQASMQKVLLRGTGK